MSGKLYIAKHKSKKAAKNHKQKIENRGGKIVFDKKVEGTESIHYVFPEKPKAKKKKASKKSTKKRK